MKAFRPTVSVLFAITVFVAGTQAISVEEDLTISSSEKKTLQKFRSIVGPKLKNDYQKEDIYLIRWLRAKNWDLKRAEDMLLQDIKWREEKNIDAIEDQDWSDMNEEFPWSVDGVDNEGRPILGFNFDDWNIRKGIIAGKGQRFLHHYTRMFEKTAKRIRQLQADGKNVTQWILLITVKNFDLVTQGCIPCLALYANLVPIYESHYPGSLDKLIFVNVPGIFEIVLNVLRSVMTPTTRKALRVYGTNKNEWDSILFKDIQRDQLPPLFGGTKE